MELFEISPIKAGELAEYKKDAKVCLFDEINSFFKLMVRYLYQGRYEVLVSHMSQQGY